MARKFVFGETKVAKTSEEIREHSESTKEEVPVIDAVDTQQKEPIKDTTASVAQEVKPIEKPMAATKKRNKLVKNNRLAIQGAKTENGIVVNVPMDDYMQLTMLKIRTSRTLKDLALQAIHEFVERNK